MAYQVKAGVDSVEGCEGVLYQVGAGRWGGSTGVGVMRQGRGLWLKAVSEEKARAAGAGWKLELSGGPGPVAPGACLAGCYTRL